MLDDPQIGSQPSSLTLNQPLVEVRPDWLRVAELGLSAEELGFAVAALSDGAFVDEYFVGDDKVDIYLYSQAGNAQDLSALPELPIATAAGRKRAPSVAEPAVAVAAAAIGRAHGGVTTSTTPGGALKRAFGDTKASTTTATGLTCCLHRADAC